MTRQDVFDEMVAATTLEAIEDARRKAHAWLVEHPEDAEFLSDAYRYLRRTERIVTVYARR